MKNKNEETSFLKENGFLIALYSIVGILIVVALSLTFMDREPMNDVQVEENNNSVSVDNSLTESYKDQVAQNEEISFLPETPNENKEVAKSNETVTNDNPENQMAPSVSNDDVTENANLETNPNADVSVNVEYKEIPEKNEKAPNIRDDEEETTKKHESSNSRKDDNEMSYSFSETSQMIWPTLGDVVMLFSSDALIYDQTLDQYRTNDSISISADVGSTVLAAADGKVVDINNDNKTGNYITMNHGNGWMTTYSQLDDLSVDIGDDVRAGDILGKVATPTKYGVNLGTHLDFKVTQNDVPIDPMNVLN